MKTNLQVMPQLQQAWQGLEPRQQKLLVIAGPLILVLMLYWLLTQTNLTRQLVSWVSWKPSSNSAQLEEKISKVHALEARLVELKTLNAQQWQALAASAGLQEIQAKAAGENWHLEARAHNLKQVEKFLASAAAQGWQWRNLSLAGSPIILNVELIPL